VNQPREIPAPFWELVREQDDTGCWIWSGPVGSKSQYPVYRRRAAWRWAYEKIQGEIPKYGHYPVVEQCEGPLFCVNPDHRLGLPSDQALIRHKCGVCKQWHDPEIDQ
jgi:hypothetical protein